jgi:cell division septation protein DedD
LALKPIVGPLTVDLAAADSSSPQPVPPVDGQFLVAVGAYGSTARASRLVETLAANGFRAFARTLSLRDRVLHQVWLGPFDALSTAQQELERLRSAGDYADAHILPARRPSDQAP